MLPRIAALEFVLHPSLRIQTHIHDAQCKLVMRRYALGLEQGAREMFVARLATTCPATVTPLGAGCTGAGGSPALTATSLPWLGATCRSRATGLPANSLAIEVLGYTSLSVPLAAILPQGVAGCMLTTAPDLLLLHLPNAGTVEMALPLAPSIVFAGFVLHQQVVALSLGPTFDIVALTSSNSLQLTEGWF